MKSIKIDGAGIKADNGSGRSLAQAFPQRRFHAKAVYVVRYNGVCLDNSTVTEIRRSRTGWL